MVPGHLEVKKGYYYIVLNYVDENGKRNRPWIPTGLPEKGNKRKAEAMLSKVRNSYEPPKVTEEGFRSILPTPIWCRVPSRLISAKQR